MTGNRAAFIYEPKTPFRVEDTPVPTAGPNEVVIKNYAVAINPVDAKVQQWGIFLKHYPNVLGADVAGEVHEVGPGVRHVKKGDRVMGFVSLPILSNLPSHAFSLVTQNPRDGGFQNYTVCTSLVVSRIPSYLSYAQAAVLPLSISTASECLFKRETLRLPLPHFSALPLDKSVLVWGGSTSVGASAVQLAVAAGVIVISVAGKHNLSSIEDLGAAEVFDYRSPSVAKDVISALEGTQFLGVCDCIGTEEAVRAWTPVYEALGGRLGSVLPLPENLPRGIEGESVFAPKVAGEDRYIGEAVWREYIPEALDDRIFKAKPDPVVVKGGLEKVQEAVDLWGRGVSFEKIVVEL
ncbi:GroES-like protein [Sporormia fimetaria CBS 119925]|uniref:GroES-like protein n=1 Tax=Sporormia fimetaria CBS 119925 TaxID=1340428 RepID=A0A6A6VKF1_9PLEO|nr:GroES-like protein [Sporormia fimetaria CBS 119925]